METANKRDIKVENIGIDQGLSQGMINDLVEDSLGYLWVATKDGLNRYDGSGFKVFRHNPLDSTSVSDNFVYSLLLDSKGRLWVGTQSNGVNLFNPRSQNFIRFSERELGSRFIGELIEDGDGNILVETLDEKGYQVLLMSEQEDRYPLSTNVRVTPISTVHPVLESIQSGQEYTKYLHFDKLGGLWYFRQDTIFYSSKDVQQYGGNPKVFTGYMQMAMYFNSAPLPVFIENRPGNLYITDWSNRVFRFNYSRQQFDDVVQLPNGYQFKETMLLDDADNLWCIANNFELFKIDLAHRKLQILSPNWNTLPADMYLLHSGFYTQDRNGNIWSGTGGAGLLKINSKAERFKTIKGLRETIVGSYHTFRLAKRNGVTVYDRDLAVKTIPYLKDPVTVLNESKDFKLLQSNANLCIDDDGNFWTGGVDENSAFLVKIDLDNGTHQRYCSHKLESDTWFGIPVFLDEKENVWFSERYSKNGVNLYRFNSELSVLDTFKFPIDRAKYKYRFVSDWTFDKEGKLWLGTMNGVFSLDQETGKWQHFKGEPSEGKGLSGNQVLSVCFDPLQDSILWVGTEGSGLNRLNILNGTVTEFTTEDGLPNNVIYAIQADEYNNIWMSTNYGLCLFNTTNYKNQNFSTLDGLPHNEFNRYEYSRSKEGELYFGGIGGVVHFDPEDFYSKGKVYQPIISQLLLFNKPVEFGATEAEQLLPKPIEQCDELWFNHDADMISFGFSLLDLTAPAKNRFRYQLSGLSDEWIEIGHTGLATFTDLESGEYVLNVIGLGSDNVWSSVPTSLVIHVKAPWYGTWWFRFIVMAVVFLSLYLLYRVRIAQLLRIERMRNSIAQDLHDEIGSTLSSISLFSSVLQSKLHNSDEKSVVLLEKISSSTSEMMESMNDMVWTIKADNDRFEHVINRMRAFSVNLCEAKGTHLTFEADNSADNLNLDMRLRKNLYLIFKEAVNNSVKYSEADSLRISIMLSNSILLVMVQDNGIGFDQSAQTKSLLNLGGNGLSGMKKRAEEIGAQIDIDSENGTRIDVRVRL